MAHIRQPEFGRRLRKLREGRGLSQRDLAGDVVDPSYISLLESGSRLPTLQVVVQLGGALGVSLSEFIGPVTAPEQDGEDRNSRMVSDILARSSLDFGDLASAQERFTGAYESARQAGRVVAALDYGMALQEILDLRADQKARYAQLVELTPLAEELGISELVLAVEINRATAARETGRLSEALELAEHVVALIGNTTFANTGEHVRALGVLVALRCESGRLSQLTGPVQAMLDIADRLGSPAVSGRAHWVAGTAFAKLGDAERVERHVRHAKERLATPAISLREWARFCRAAASALLDVEADIGEIEQLVRGAKAALSIVDVPGETDLLRLVRARCALVFEDTDTALELTEDEPSGLAPADVVLLRVTRGRALRKAKRVDEAIEVLRGAARLAEELELYQLGTRIWREIDETRSDLGA